MTRPLSFREVDYEDLAELSEIAIDAPYSDPEFVAEVLEDAMSRRIK